MGEEITQALVLIGGTASRLRKDGVAVSETKSFLSFQGRPLLHWTLCALHRAGIRKLVLSGSTVATLYKGSKIVRSVPYVFDRIDYFQDEGLGAHGIPYELRYMLDGTFIFECGHSFSKLRHYQQLCKHMLPNSVVFSAYLPHPSNLRQPVLLQAGRAYYSPLFGHHAVAHPIVADTEYAKSLAGLEFSIHKIISHLSNTQRLIYVLSSTAPEFDTKAEMQSAFEQYKKIITEFATV